MFGGWFFNAYLAPKMLNIEGYICIAHISEPQPGLDLLYGKNNDRGQGIHEPLTSNGLMPFADLVDAKLAQIQIKNRPLSDLTEVSIGQIKLGIAENKSDLDLFAKIKRPSFIVIWQSLLGQELVGRTVKDRFDSIPSIPGGLLSENGLQPLRSFESAEHLVVELARQAQSHALIAKYSLKFFDCRVSNS